MSFGRASILLVRRSPTLAFTRHPLAVLRRTTSCQLYHSDANNNNKNNLNKNADNSNDLINTANDNNSSNQNDKANNGNVNVTLDKSKTYQDTISAVQALSRSQIEKLQRDIQPLIHKVQDATNTLKRLTHDVTDSKDALRRASMALNELTGYNQIELVKKKVTEQAMTFELTRDQVQISKKRYELAIATRSHTQRSINELLQRKHLWTGEDVTQFTELYRLEHEHAKEEDFAKEQYHQKEKQMDREYMALARSIMERYHDEQLWSDKIRSVSTYGTWALMVLNLMLFVAVQTVFEPRKRKRLTDRFEELLVDKVAEQEEKFGEVADRMAHTDEVLIQQQQALVELVTQMAESSSRSHLVDTWAEQPINTGTPPLVITEQVESETPMVIAEQIESETPMFIEEKQDGSLLGMDSVDQQQILPDVSLTAPSDIDSSDYDLGRHTLVTNDTIAPTDSSSIVLSQHSLILYSLESAVAGGLITALAVFLWK